MSKLTGFLFIVLVMISLSCSNSYNDDGKKYVIAYYFPKDSIAVDSLIAVEKLTHINYAFANIKNGEMIEGFKNDSINFSILNQTKLRNPELKILVSVGGWTWSGEFSDVSLTEASRKKFNDSIIKFLELHKLDGIDIDWEFPNLEGYGNVYRPEDKQNFTYLLKELRENLDEAGEKNNKHYLLTIASGSFDDYIANTEIDKCHQYLDFMNIMAYDMYESDYDSVAGHHTPLFTNPSDKKGGSADRAVQKYLQLGVPPWKIVLGVAFYGRAWEAASSVNHGLYQPAGPVKERISTSFKNLMVNYENKNGYLRYWDSVSCAPYLFNVENNIFITYDDNESLKAKSDYIIKNKLKGAMFWEYHSDYENNLLQILYDGLISTKK